MNLHGRVRSLERRAQVNEGDDEGVKVFLDILTEELALSGIDAVDVRRHNRVGGEDQFIGTLRDLQAVQERLWGPHAPKLSPEELALLLSEEDIEGATGPEVRAPLPQLASALPQVPSP